ncbi:MAG: phage holin family protein [Myxococcota bacterium]
MRLLLRWLVIAISLGITAYLLPGIGIRDWQALIVGSAVLGLVNAIAKPVLTVLTFPITVLTLGLFLFVVNGLSFALAAWFVPGFEVLNLGWAMLGAIVVSIISWFLSGLDDVGSDDRDDR